jgi:hypothetical protein
MIKEQRMKSYVVWFIFLLSLSVAAQQPAAPKAPQVPAAPAAPAPPAPPVDPEQGGQPINIRLDVSVLDQTAQGATQPKSLMVMLVDRAMGRTRAAFQDRSIAVDARPVLVDGRIRVYLTLQSEASRSFGPPKETEDHTINWRNSFSLLLENGKPMLALETMDAVTKRKMSIEVKATIQK